MRRQLIGLSTLRTASQRVSQRNRLGRLPDPIINLGGLQQPNAPSPLRGVAISLAAPSSGRRPYSSTSYAWGFDGLALFLRKASARLADSAPLDQGSSPNSTTGWLAQLPIPADAELTVSDASDELALLSERFFTASAARELFAAQLLALWPADSAPALKALLSSLDYIKGSSD